MQLLKKASRLKNLLFSSWVFLWGLASPAQPCTAALLDTLHGSWKLIRTGSIPSSVSKADMAKEKLLMEGAIEVVRQNIPRMPVGGDIGYGVFWENNDPRPGPVKNSSNTYYAKVEYNLFHCYEGKVNGDGLYGGTDICYLQFNELPFTFGLSFYTPGPKATELDRDPGTNVYAVLRSLPIVKDGYFDFINDNKDGLGNSTGTVYRYRTLTKPGKLPYAVMSKREFYENWKIKYQIEIENEVAEKERFKKELAGNNQLDGLLKQMDQFIALYQGYINKFEGFFKTKTAEELSRPAYEGEQEGEYFESRQATDYLRSYIVKPNFAYYNNLTGKSGPQVITLCYKYYMDVDGSGNKKYECPKFHQALEEMKIFDLLREKLSPLIVP